jgi:hypothetical protein
VKVKHARDRDRDCIDRSQRPTNINPLWAAVSTFHISSFRKRFKLASGILWEAACSMSRALCRIVSLMCAPLFVRATVAKIGQPKFFPLSTYLNATIQYEEAVMRALCSLRPLMLLIYERGAPLLPCPSFLEVSDFAGTLPAKTGAHSGVHASRRSRLR